MIMPAAGPARTVWSAGDVARDADGYPVTRTAAGVLRGAAGTRELAVLDERISGCRACPRLVAWREEVARVRRRA